MRNYTYSLGPHHECHLVLETYPLWVEIVNTLAHWVELLLDKIKFPDWRWLSVTDEDGVTYLWSDYYGSAAYIMYSHYYNARPGRYVEDKIKTIRIASTKDQLLSIFTDEYSQEMIRDWMDT
jgi:hypothetical protein